MMEVVILLGLASSPIWGFALYHLVAWLWREPGRRRKLRELKSRQVQLDALGRELDQFQRELEAAEQKTGAPSSATRRSRGDVSGRSP
jgi:hypothetical protein